MSTKGKSAKMERRSDSEVAHPKGTLSPADMPLQDADTLLALQQAAGNMALQRRLAPAGARLSRNGLSLQRAPANGGIDSATATPEPETAAAGLIVDDGATELGPGQIKRSDFLAQIKDAVCRAAEEALAGTLWSVAGCPFIERWLSYYSGQDARHIESAVHRYAPETRGLANAADYIPLIAARVRTGVTTWRETGEVAGVPADISLPKIPSGPPSVDLSSGLSSVASALTGGLFFKRHADASPASSDPRAVQARLGQGRALDGGVRGRMESAFGTSLGGVRVHTDAVASGLAAELQARAFTVGRDVAFAGGEYHPGTPVGDALIAHELAHVVQQRGASSAGLTQQRGPAYDSLEEEADESAVGAVTGIWSGAKSGLADISRNAMPRLRSGLRLQRCKSERQKELERLGKIQYDFLEKKRKEEEERKKKEAEEAAKNAGLPPPATPPKVTLEDTIEEETKKSGFSTHPDHAWTSLSDADKKAWEGRAAAVWTKVLTSVKGMELETVLKGKSFSFEPAKALTKGYYAWQSGKTLAFGMSFVKDAEADVKNVWPNVAHEMGGHFEYGKEYAGEIMTEALKHLPEADRKKWETDEGRRMFYLRYEYPETEIFAELRERRYTKPESGPAPSVITTDDPDVDIPNQLKQIKDGLDPVVAKAVVTELKRRVDASPNILERDKKFFALQVKAVFGYVP